MSSMIVVPLIDYHGLKGQKFPFCFSAMTSYCMVVTFCNEGDDVIVFFRSSFNEGRDPTNDHSHFGFQERQFEINTQVTNLN